MKNKKLRKKSEYHFDVEFGQESIFGIHLGVRGRLGVFFVLGCPDAHLCTADPRRLGEFENWPPGRPQTTKWMPETDSPPKKTSRMNLDATHFEVLCVRVYLYWRDVCRALSRGGFDRP